MPNSMTKIIKIICTHRERLSHPHLIDLGSRISIWRAEGSSYLTTERSQGKLPATDAGICRFGAHPLRLVTGNFVRSLMKRAVILCTVIFAGGFSLIAFGRIISVCEIG